MNDVKPVSSEGPGVALGVILCLCLHLAALIVVAIIGTAIGGREGALLTLPFIAFVGLTQWIYLGPAAWLLRRRGARAVAMGVVITGGLVTLVNAIGYGGMKVMTLRDAAQVARINEYTRAHPSDFISATGVVTAVDDAHFEFRRPDGTVVSLRTWKGLDHVFLKKNGGYEMRTRDMLQPGVRVSVDYSQDRGKPPVSPMIVRV